MIIQSSASELERGRVETRILGVRKDALVLETLIDSKQEKYALRQQARADAEAARQHRQQQLLQLDDDQDHNDRGECTDDGASLEPRPPRCFGLHKLPEELTALVAEFLQEGAAELSRCSLTCRGVWMMFVRPLFLLFPGVPSNHHLIAWISFF